MEGGMPANPRKSKKRRVKKRKQIQDGTYLEGLDKKAQIQSFGRPVPFTWQFAK